VGHRLEDAVKAHRISALCVVRSGETVVAVGPQDMPLPISSVRKSIISALFGRLIARGDVQLSTTLADFGIDDCPCPTDQERTATLQHLLTSCSGVYLPLHSEAYDIFRNRPSDWPQRGSTAPGTKFHYSNWDFNVLGEIYQRVSEPHCSPQSTVSWPAHLAFAIGTRWSTRGCVTATTRSARHRDTRTTRCNCPPATWHASGNFISMREYGWQRYRAVRLGQGKHPDSGRNRPARPVPGIWLPVVDYQRRWHNCPATRKLLGCRPWGTERLSDPVASDGDRRAARGPGRRVHPDGTPD
jgi:hypothetical protein